MDKKQALTIGNEIEKSAPAPGFELSEKQIDGLRTAGEVALALSVVAGTIALTAIAPNIFTALDKIFGKKQYGTKKDTLEKRKKQLKRSFYYLRDQGYINIEKKGEWLFIAPTQKGRKRMDKIAFSNLQVNNPRKWKGSWWLVLADIPSKQFRGQAYYFQKKLKSMGFYPLQRTVWIHPFDPRGEIEAVAAHFKLNPFITTMEVKRLDPSDEKDLKNFFKRLLGY